MATFVDVGLFSHFSVVVTFLFVFVLLYALLSAQKVIKFGDGERGIYALISLSLAFLAVISGNSMKFITAITPWFTAVVIILFFVLFIFRLWTGDDDTYFKEMFKHSGGLRWTLFVVVLLIVIFALFSTFGQTFLERNQGTAYQDQQIVNGGVVDASGTTVIAVDNSAARTGQVTDAPVNSVATNDLDRNVLATFAHPKILGLLLFLLIGFFSILLLASNTNPNN